MPKNTANGIKLEAAAHNNDGVVLIGWDRILQATGLHCQDAPPARATPPAGRRP